MIGVMIVWASFYSIIKIVVATVDPLTLSFLRYFLGLIPLTPFVIRDWRQRPVRPSVRETMEMAVLGLLGVTGFALFLFFGLNLSTAVNGALLANTQPIFTAILGALILSEAFTANRSVGIFIGFAGMVLVVTGGNLTLIATGDSVFVGNLLLIGASLSLSLYSVLIKKSVSRFGSMIPTWLSMAFGTAVLWLINAIRREPSFVLRTMSPAHIALVVYLGVIGTSLTYLVFNRTLAHMHVVVATSYKMLIPVFGLVFAVIFIQETPNGWTLAGVCIVLASIAIVQGFYPRRRA